MTKHKKMLISISILIITLITFLFIGLFVIWPFPPAIMYVLGLIVGIIIFRLPKLT